MGARAATIAQHESSYQSPDANVNALALNKRSKSVEGRGMGALALRISLIQF